MLILSAGKGGEGKTTVTALLGAKHAQSGGTVVELDCDTNQKLHEKHVNGQEPDPLFAVIEAHLELLYGRNNYIPDFSEAPKSTPPNPSSPLFFGLSPAVNPLVNAAGVLQPDGVISMRTGELSAEEQLSHCNHFLTGSGLRLGLHTVVQPGELLLSDMMAGNDNGTSGLPSIADGAFVVVKPEKDGLLAYDQIVTNYEEYGVPNIVVVANQVEDDEDLEFIKAGIRHEVACVIPPAKKFFRRRNAGESIPLPEGIAKEIGALHQVIKRWAPRDPREKFLSAVNFHNHNYPVNAIPADVARIGADSYARRVEQGSQHQAQPRHSEGPRSGVVRGSHVDAAARIPTVGGGTHGSPSNGNGPIGR